MRRLIAPVMIVWATWSAASAAETDEAAVVGRPVRVVSIGFSSRPVGKIAEIVDREAHDADLVILPEVCTGQKTPEPLDGRTIRTIAGLAKKHNTYIVCPIERMDGLRRYNSAVLIGRKGDIVGVYDKVFPFWGEYDLVPTVEVGGKAAVFQTDFGRLGLAICFDSNYPELWQAMAEHGADLVAWPSAYSGGMTLQARAIDYHYYVVSSTLQADCTVFDITGDRLLYRKSDDVNVARITLDLDRGIYHKDFNVPKRDKLLKARAADVIEEKTFDLEGWFVLKARRPGVSVRALAKEYGLEELRDYVSRSRREINAKRGTPFVASPGCTTSTSDGMKER